MSISYRLANLSDLSSMIRIGDELFDLPIKESRAREFLRDPRHHLMLAYDGEKIVGMASGVHYVHPDKDPELFINEVGVVDTHQRRGIGRQLVRELIDYAREQLDCCGAWVLTTNSNVLAQKTYEAAGGRKEAESLVMYEF